MPGYWDQVAIHEARGLSRQTAMRAATLILERRDPSHFAWDEILHPRNRSGEFTLSDVTHAAHPPSKLPAMTAKQIHRMLRKAGFRRVGQKGSHAVFEHPDGGRRVIVPMHTGSIPTGTLRNILATAGATL
jgi:predicted RNA binding protein YcfA (HicA-like mRNA interferase family)